VGFEKGRSLSEIEGIIDEKKKKYDEGIVAYGEKGEAYRAMQTCQAWDTIYDPVLHSPITMVSRIWNKQWGGNIC